MNQRLEEARLVLEHLFEASGSPDVAEFEALQRLPGDRDDELEALLSG